MPKIKSAAEIAEKYGRVTPARASDFEAGVKAPLENWEEKTRAAESSYELGVQTAIGNKSFGKGVTSAGNAKWQRKAIEVGVGRWGTGVRAGQPDYQKGFEPFRGVIEATALPPRFPKGDPRNLDRVNVLAKALHDAKIK
jgi:hypothetical protein